MMARLRHGFHALFCWLRFGPVRERIVAMDGGVPSEIAYLDLSGDMVGYWAYGSWDPSMPFQKTECPQ